MQKFSTVYNCTVVQHSILVYGDFCTDETKVPQSRLVDLYAAIDVIHSAVQSPLLEMHLWDGTAKGTGLSLSVAMQQCDCEWICEFYVLVAL